jgi:hypothetical protein
MFKPVDDLTPEEAYSNIFPVVGEVRSGYEPWRLIEDYVFSRNIAKYGLKFTSFQDVMKENPKMQGEYFWHMYAAPVEEKVISMKKLLKQWKLM